MTRIRVKVRRPGNPDINAIDILDFSKAFEIELLKQIDDGEPESVHVETFTPEGGQQPPEPPGPGEDDVLYDSHRDSKLHDGKKRTIEKEGDISPGGLGVECRASGDPRIQVNEDGTFSLLCDKGHGRFYLYCLNYNSTLEIEAAFWNELEGQDLSLKSRSQHNEGPDDREDADSWDTVHEDAFGGCGLSIDREGWGAKIEPEHNFHPSEYQDHGDLPFDVKTKEYFKIEFTTKDDGGDILQIGKMNGKQFMEKRDKPKDYMVDKPRYDKQSYFWVRSNIDEDATGELRIKSLRILKA